MRSKGIGAVLAAVLLVWATGCQPPLDKDESSTQERLLASRQRVVQLEGQLDEKNRQIEQLEQQNATLLELGPTRLDNLFYPTKLHIKRTSGGIDETDDGIDDGVVVYLQPIDADGDVVKCAGDIIVQLYDLAQPDESQLIAEYIVDVAHGREAWYGHALTDHFKIWCPWRSLPPANSEITIRATFVDNLSGARLTTQRAVQVALTPR